MVWNAFPSVEAAMVGSLKYDPYKAGGQITKLRELKHSAIWKSLKSFRLEPGHEVVARVKVKQENINAFVNKMAELEKKFKATDILIFSTEFLFLLLVDLKVKL